MRLLPVRLLSVRCANDLIQYFSRRVVSNSPSFDCVNDACTPAAALPDMNQVMQLRVPAFTAMHRFRIQTPAATPLTSDATVRLLLQRELRKFNEDTRSLFLRLVAHESSQRHPPIGVDSV